MLDGGALSRGDITTTISFLTTQKVALSTSETVGSAITQSLSVFPKFGPVSLPEFGAEVRFVCHWGRPG